MLLISYFIRKTDDNNVYIHYDGKDQNGDSIYVLRRGEIGACLFTEQNAKNFIEAAEDVKLEMVKARDVLNTLTPKA